MSVNHPKPTIGVIRDFQDGAPITVPQHSWFTSPARSHATISQGKELPLHLVSLILSHLDNAGDLARVTRASRLFYYMTLPRLYEHVTLRSYSEIRYVNGRPEGYGNGSPFAMGLNTLVSRNYSDYVKSFRVVGDWREHDTDDYSRGRVPDNSMMLQVAMRAALDNMKNLTAFAWELNTKPLQTVYQSLVARPSITSLTLRCQTKRIRRPTTLIPPLPNLVTLVVYDIDPLCYPDDISLLLVRATKLENLKLHWVPRMRESGEESIVLLNYFGRCVAAKVRLPVKRLALYNLYTRNSADGTENITDDNAAEEITIINCMGSSDPMTVFLDDTWRHQDKPPVPPNLKMMRTDLVDKDHVNMLSTFKGLERLYLISRRKTVRTTSSVPTPPTPSTGIATHNEISTNSTSAGNSACNTPVSELECRSLAGDYLAVIQSHHRTMRHLLLADHWVLNDNALFNLCQSCSDLEQLGFSCSVPPFEILRKIVGLCPKLFALRNLIRPGSEFAERMESELEEDMHTFVMGTELWRPEYASLKYIGFGDKNIYELGAVVYPPKNRSIAITPGHENSMNARRMGPVRLLKKIGLDAVKHIEIWSMDNTEFDSKFP